MADNDNSNNLNDNVNPGNTGGDGGQTPPAADNPKDTATPPATQNNAQGSADGEGAADASGKGNGILSGNGEGDKKDTPDNVNIPEEYKLNFPEGFVADKETLDAVSPTLRELGATQEQVQKLSDEVCKLITRQRAADAEANMKLADESIAELKNDAEFGGKKWEESRAAAKKAVQLLAGKDADELTVMLDETGMSGYAPLFKLLVRAGQKLAVEDGFVPGGASSGGELSDEDMARLRFPERYK